MVWKRWMDIEAISNLNSVTYYNSLHLQIAGFSCPYMVSYWLPGNVECLERTYQKYRLLGRKIDLTTGAIFICWVMLFEHVELTHSIIQMALLITVESGFISVSTCNGGVVFRLQMWFLIKWLAVFNFHFPLFFCSSNISLISLKNPSFAFVYVF